MSRERGRQLYARLLRAAADEATDAADHDELHAAAVVAAEDWTLLPPAGAHYVHRWLDGLVARVGTVEPVSADPGASTHPGQSEPHGGM